MLNSFFADIHSVLFDTFEPIGVSKTRCILVAVLAISIITMFMAEYVSTGKKSLMLIALAIGFFLINLVKQTAIRVGLDDVSFAELQKYMRMLSGELLVSIPVMIGFRWINKKFFIPRREKELEREIEKLFRREGLDINSPEDRALLSDDYNCYF